MKQLNALHKHVRDTIQALSDRQWQAKCDAAWEVAKAWESDTVLYCCAPGTFIGGDIQRGDSFKVSVVQPRAHRVWTTDKDGRARWFVPAGLVRYDLRTTPPENPLGADEREVAYRIAKACAAL